MAPPTMEVEEVYASDEHAEYDTDKSSSSDDNERVSDMEMDQDADHDSEAEVLIEDLSAVPAGQSAGTIKKNEVENSNEKIGQVKIDQTRTITTASTVEVGHKQEQNHNGVPRINHTTERRMPLGSDEPQQDNSSEKNSKVRFANPIAYTQKLAPHTGTTTTRDVPGKVTRSTLRVIAKSPESIKDTIFQRGQKLVETEKVLLTAIKCEFNIAQNVTEYNVRAQFIKLLVLLQRQDRKLKIQSEKIKDIEWINVDKLPEDEDFVQAFSLVTREFRTHKKVIVHCNVISEKSFNALKYSPEVKDYIFGQNIWIKVDHYGSKEEASPGFFVMMHPRLTHREEFTNEIRNLLSVHENSNTKGRADSARTSTDEQPSSTQVDAQEKLPDFHLEISQKKWGQVKTEIIRVNCALDDAEVLKTKLTVLSETSKLGKGLFVPVGLHLMTGSETMTNILTEHIKFVTKIRGIPITGISIPHMNERVGPNSKSVKEMLLSLNGVTGVEKTSDTWRTGKWIVITTMVSEQSVLSQIKQLLGKLKVPSMESNMEITAGRQGIWSRNHNSNIVSTYAEILAKKFETPQPRYGTTQQGSQYRGSRNTPREEAVDKKTMAQIDKNISVPGSYKLKNAETTLIKRIDEIDKKWKEMEDRLKEKQKQLEITIAQSQADNTDTNTANITTAVFKHMEKKFEHLNGEQTRQMEEMETKLLKKVDKKLDSKVDEISLAVAHKVTLHLQEVLAPLTGQFRTNISAHQTTVTQEGTPMRASIGSPPDDRFGSETIAHSKADPLTQMAHQDKPTSDEEQHKCSPHDTVLEHGSEKS